MRIIRSINIEKEIWDLLDRLAKDENRSKSNMIEMLILNYNSRWKIVDDVIIDYNNK